MSSAYWVGVRMETAMSLVTWSPAIGITAVWRIAPLANTARSVVPPPMSTRHTPSSFSSSVSTAKLEASCSSTTSSTSSPQRWMHFSMFCAALSAPVTMCTFASSRTPDMLIGSRMPSWPSTMNSWGRTWRIFWSAGMATALAASMTCSTSPCVTSLSRIATTPCEFRLRTWLPAMPANTEWISHPAMSSASSTARWMDCTVDSMLTTTPFFRPREGCEPTPSTSIPPSGPTSPTRATILEVPMSSPTMRFLSESLSIATAILVRLMNPTPLARRTHSAQAVLLRCGNSGAAAPTDCEPVGVPHVHVLNVIAALGHQLQRRRHEFLEPLIELAAAEPHRHPVRQIEFPRAARVQPHRRHAQPRLQQPALHGQVLLRDHRFLAVRPGQLRQLRRNVPLRCCEQLATTIEQPVGAPTCGRYLLDHQNVEAARPRALHAHRIDPGDLVECLAHGREIHTQQPHSTHMLLDDPLDVSRCDSLKASGDGDRLNGLVERPQHAGDDQADTENARCRSGHPAPVDAREPTALTLLGLLPAAVLRTAEHRQPPPVARRTKLVSSNCQTRSSNDRSTARAAIGTRLWLVMPGTVLISSSSGRPVASIMKSARPHPSAPAASKAASARFPRCCSAGADSPEGQKYR